jgi:MscS family membrane protein
LVDIRPSSVFARPRRWGFIVAVVALWLAVPAAAGIVDDAPLRPLDTSSPRALLQDFSASVDAAYSRMTATVRHYVASDHLYFDAEERAALAQIDMDIERVMRGLDLSQIPSVLRGTVGAERSIQLKEVLDRIDLPAETDIPDRVAMERTGEKKWRLPNTEIDIVLVPGGPRAGEFIVSAETVARLPVFYERVKSIPYRPGPAKELNDIYRAVGGSKTATVYEAASSSPAMLGMIVPIRWMLQLPAWAKLRIFGAALWQWIGLAATGLFAAAAILLAYRLRRRLAARRAEDAGPDWDALLVPITVLVRFGGLLPTVRLLFGLAGDPGIGAASLETVVRFLTIAWIAVIGASVIAEKIVASEHLRMRSLDSQLIRLGMRLFGIAIAIGVLIEGADELGFPAYSVLAGLGVGGLAVALAARDSLANLLGSMLIMLEKPFRVGHAIRIGTTEGTVEDVGFRSTRIRTADNSLVSDPEQFGGQHHGGEPERAADAAAAFFPAAFIRDPAREDRSAGGRDRTDDRR